MGTMMAGRVTILLFATARLAAGTARVRWPVERTGTPASVLVAALSRRYPKLGPVLRTSRFVLNGEYVDALSTRIRPGDEFAVHPPYGGG